MEAGPVPLASDIAEGTGSFGITHVDIMFELAVNLTFGGLLCYGALSAAFWRKCFDASVLTKALLRSAMLTIKATEVRSCPWSQCDSASG